MRYFVVIVTGRNLLLRLQDPVVRTGFHAVRVVAANSESVAIESAIESVQNDESLLGLLLPGENLGELAAELKSEAERMPPESENRGFIFFEEESGA